MTSTRQSATPSAYAPALIWAVMAMLSSFACLSIPGSALAQETKPVFRAGASTSNISPPLDSSLNGGFQDRKAQFIHDELHARTIVLDDGKSRLAFIVCDLCMIPRSLVLDAKEQIRQATGIAPENVVISATHTHSAPTCDSVFQSDPSEAYRQFLAKRIADGTRRAVHNLVAARIGWGMGRNTTQAHNRRWKMKPGTIPPNPFGQVDQVQMNPPVASPNLVEPAGPIDPEVAVLSLRRLDGSQIALLANFALHYVGDTGPGHVSADYFGAFADRVQELMSADRRDPPFVAILSNGTCGDINNINFRQPRKAGPAYSRIRAVADELAREAVRVASEIRYRDHVTLDARATTIELGVRRPDEAELERARAIVARAKGPEMKTSEEVYAREALKLKDYPAAVPVTLAALRVGDLAVLAIPCEVFVEIGLELKRTSPFEPTFTIELANGYNGYLPTEKHHALGGYETWRARSSYLEVGASTKIVGEIQGLLKELASQRPLNDTRSLPAKPSQPAQ